MLNGSANNKEPTLSWIFYASSEDHIIDIQKERDATVVLVEHDLGVVMDISDSIYVLDFGELIGAGTPEEVVKIPKVIEAYIGEE